MRVLAKDWAETSANLIARHPGMAPTLSSLDGLGSMKVFHASIPYGTPLIQGGTFCWDIFEQLRGQLGYGDAPIPVGIVLERSIELFEEGPFQRSVPLYLLQSGEFFGLFQNFSGDFPQPKLQANAGGTTLIVLPPMGNQVTVQPFAKQWNYIPKEALIRNLKVSNKSKLLFGEFFAGLVAANSCAWRLEIAFLPFEFVESIKRDAVAHAAILSLALTQMVLTCKRAEKETEVLTSRDERDRGHITGVRLISNGLRPGFTPVFCTDADEQVLPARDIYEKIYLNGPKAAGGKKLFDGDIMPFLFRPSLLGEDAYYFMSRPYVEEEKGRSNGCAKIATENLGNNKTFKPLKGREDFTQEMEQSMPMKAFFPQVTLPEHSPFMDNAILIRAGR